MKKSVLVLITGISLTAIAIFLVSYSSISILDKYPTTEVLFFGQELSPGSSIGGFVEIDFPDDFYVGVRAMPENQQIILSITSEQGTPVITAPVEGVLFERLSGVQPGYYQIDINHFGSEPVKIFSVLTAHDIHDEIEKFEQVGGLALAGIILIVPGILLLIGSGAFIIYRKLKQGRQSSQENF